MFKENRDLPSELLALAACLYGCYATVCASVKTMSTSLATTYGYISQIPSIKQDIDSLKQDMSKVSRKLWFLPPWG
jgi:hypothetical protein